MRRQVRAGAVALAALMASSAITCGTSAQELEHGTTPADVERGGQIFLASCAVCHGPDGDLLSGTVGVDLGSGTFRRASTDQQLAHLIQTGIPGTPMPPNALSDADAARVVAYLRSLPAIRRATGSSTAVRGNAMNGRAIYEGKGGCGACHLVNGSGGFLGPDLSSTGVARRAAEVEQSLVDPSAEVRTGNRTVSVVRADGTAMTGRLLNQDTHTIQMIDDQGHLLSFDKDAVRSWDIPSGSVMPSYRDKLTPEEIADVVSYLMTLTAPPPAGATGRGGGRGGPGGGGRGAAPERGIGGGDAGRPGQPQGSGRSGAQRP
jgi:putative heme-binding domain-containing protein